MNVTGNTSQLTAADREELARLLAHEIAFIDHESFHLPDAEQIIITDAVPLPEPDNSWLVPGFFRSSIGLHAPRRKRPVFMTEEQERSAFLQFNFARMNAARAQTAIKAGDQTDATCLALLIWHRLAMRVRNIIVGHFLFAVIRITRGWNMSGFQKDDIVSEGFRMLIELAGRFDWTRPQRFMVAVTVSVRGCCHHLYIQSKRHQRSFGEFNPTLMGSTDHIGQQREERRQHLIEELRVIVNRNTARLTEDEMKILKARYWCDVEPSSRNTLGLRALELIKAEFHIHHRRIYLLLASAMQKLRHAVRQAMEHSTITAIVAERFKNRQQMDPTTKKLLEKLAGKITDVDAYGEAIKQLEQQFSGINSDINRKIKAVKMHSFDRLGNYRGVFDSESDARAFGLLMLSQARGLDASTDELASRCAEALKSDYPDIQKRAMDSATDGALIPPEFSARLHRLVEQFGAFESNAFAMPMNSESTTFMRRTGGLTVFTLGENVAGDESKPTHGNITLTARELGTLTYAPRTLEEDSAAILGEIIALDVAQAFAESMDDDGFNGDASATYHGFTGVRTRLATVNGVNDGGGLVLGSGNLYSELTLADHEKVMGSLPTYAAADAKWYVSRNYFFTVMVRLMQAAGGVTSGEIEGKRQLMFGGDPVVICQKLPRTEANSQICALYGSLRQAATVGSRRMVQVESSKDYKFASRQITYLGHRRVAINVHDVGTATEAGPIVGLITAAS